MPSFVTHVQEDKAVVEALLRLANDKNLSGGRLSVNTDFGAAKWAHDAALPESVAQAVKLGIQVLNSATVTFSGAGNAALNVVWTRRPAGQLPLVSITPNEWKEQGLALYVTRCVREAFEAVVDDPSFNRLLRDDTQQAYAEFLSVSSRLARFNEQVAESISARRLELEGEYRAREKALAEEHAERTREAESRAEAAIAKATSELADERNALAAAHKAREESLVAREKEVDALAARHDRRRLRDEMKQVLKAREETFELTAATQKKRTWIHVVCLVTAALLITFALLPVDLAPKSVPEAARGWFEVVRRSLFFMGSAGLVTFYLRWQNAWFKQHADTEFHLRQFSLDVDRASWLVETVTDLREKEGIAVPERLLEALTVGLFEPRDRGGEETEPTVETLARTLMASDRVKLSVAGQEVEISGRRIRGELS